MLDYKIVPAYIKLVANGSIFNVMHRLLPDYVNEPLNIPVIDGYEFIGWFDKPEGGNQIDFSKRIDAGEYSESNPVMIYGQYKKRATEVENLKDFMAALALGGEIKLTANIDVTEQLFLTKDVVLDMNGKTLSNSVDLWDQTTGSFAIINTRYTDLTVKGNGKIIAKADDCFCINAIDGSVVTIEDGTFIGNISSAYVQQGIIKVLGGSFDIQQKDPRKGYEFELNCLDQFYRDGTAKIEVSGGRFVGFNPAANAAESTEKTTNFVIEGYKSVEVSEGVFDVVKDEA